MTRKKCDDGKGDALIKLSTTHPPPASPVEVTMFKLIRRISSSVFPRNDRPWADDGAPLFTLPIPSQPALLTQTLDSDVHCSYHWKETEIKLR